MTAHCSTTITKRGTVLKMTATIDLKSETMTTSYLKYTTCLRAPALVRLKASRRTELLFWTQTSAKCSHFRNLSRPNWYSNDQTDSSLGTMTTLQATHWRNCWIFRRHRQSPFMCLVGHFFSTWPATETERAKWSLQTSSSQRRTLKSGITTWRSSCTTRCGWRLCRSHAATRTS